MKLERLWKGARKRYLNGGGEVIHWVMENGNIYFPGNLDRMSILLLKSVMEAVSLS